MAAPGAALRSETATCRNGPGGREVAVGAPDPRPSTVIRCGPRWNRLRPCRHHACGVEGRAGATACPRSFSSSEPGGSATLLQGSLHRREGKRKDGHASHRTVPARSAGCSTASSPLRRILASRGTGASAGTLGPHPLHRPEDGRERSGKGYGISTADVTAASPSGDWTACAGRLRRERRRANSAGASRARTPSRMRGARKSADVRERRGKPSPRAGKASAPSSKS